MFMLKEKCCLVFVFFFKHNVFCRLYIGKAEVFENSIPLSLQNVFLPFFFPSQHGAGRLQSDLNKAEWGNAQQDPAGLPATSQVPRSPLQTLRTLFYFMLLVSQLTTLIVVVCFFFLNWDSISFDIINKHCNEQKLLRWFHYFISILD